MGQAKQRGSRAERIAWIREVMLRDTEPRNAERLRQNGAAQALLDESRQRRFEERMKLERELAAGPIRLVNGHYPFDVPRMLAEHGLSIIARWRY